MAHQTEKSILEIKSVTNRYVDELVLNDVNLSLDRGEILCLLGSSGSGKTTLLRILAGLEPTEKGAILFDGQDLQKVPPHKRRIGMMFQEYALFPHKSVRENVAFGLEMQKVTGEDQKNKVEEMLELVGLAGFAERQIDQLSGGERQRVALARSLAPEPLLLLLDEPLGSLDRALRDRLASEIRSILKKLNVTAIFVTHDQTEAFSIADKVAILDQGELLQIDRPEELYRYPSSKKVARFLGFTNIIDGLVDTEGHFQSFKGGLVGVQPLFSIQGQAGEGALLIRPDGAQIAESEEGGIVINGIVRDCRFLGGSYWLTMASGEVLLSFSLPIDPAPPAVGEGVRIELNPASIVLLPSGA